jgi:predicted ATPase
MKKTRELKTYLSESLASVLARPLIGVWVALGLAVDPTAKLVEGIVLDRSMELVEEVDSDVVDPVSKLVEEIDSDVVEGEALTMVVPRVHP